MGINIKKSIQNGAVAILLYSVLLLSCKTLVSSSLTLYTISPNV